MAHNQISITVTKRERETLERRADKSGISLSNYVRKRLGLALKQHGGKRVKAAEQPEEIRK